MQRPEKGDGFVPTVASIEGSVRSVGGLKAKQYQNDEQGARVVILYEKRY